MFSKSWLLFHFPCTVLFSKSEHSYCYWVNEFPQKTWLFIVQPGLYDFGPLLAGRNPNSRIVQAGEARRGPGPDGGGNPVVNPVKKVALKLLFINGLNDMICGFQIAEQWL